MLKVPAGGKCEMATIAPEVRNPGHGRRSQRALSGRTGPEGQPGLRHAAQSLPAAPRPRQRTQLGQVNEAPRTGWPLRARAQTKARAPLGGRLRLRHEPPTPWPAPDTRRAASSSPRAPQGTAGGTRGLREPCACERWRRRDARGASRARSSTLAGSPAPVLRSPACLARARNARTDLAGAQVHVPQEIADSLRLQHKVLHASGRKSGPGCPARSGGPRSRAPSSAGVRAGDARGAHVYRACSAPCGPQRRRAGAAEAAVGTLRGWRGAAASAGGRGAAGAGRGQAQLIQPRGADLPARGSQQRPGHPI
jgi:hypothetical protein